MVHKTIHELFNSVFNGNSSLEFHEEDLKESFSDPSATDAVFSDNSRLLFSGTLRIPHADGLRSVPLQGVIGYKKDENGIPIIAGCEAGTSLGTWHLARGVVLVDGFLRLSCKNSRPEAFLSGKLRVLNCRNAKIGGMLDSRVLYDPSDQDRLHIGTLVSDAYLDIGNDIHLSGATIRFELCSKTHDTAAPPPYCIDEMDEYLFQCTENIGIGAMRLIGSADEPITLSLRIDALRPDDVRTLVTVQPVLLHAPVFGEENDLFASGPHGKNAFMINATGEWICFISSRPYLTLADPSDPSGALLIEGSAFFTGSLSGVGFSSGQLSIAAESFRGTAFRDGKWPQEMPDQRICLTVTESGNARMNFAFYPLVIGHMAMAGIDDKDSLLDAELSEKGLRFKAGCCAVNVIPEGEARTLPVFSIDSRCRVWVDPDNERTEIGEWLKNSGG
jgi:hypothetical protein